MMKPDLMAQVHHMKAPHWMSYMGLKNKKAIPSLDLFFLLKIKFEIQ